ncbi:MAG TPA: 50S ribosomal protein L13 [Candidatus Pacearchaeota archaeon]|nr:50S ribosomal protein L13 [Candidatus Pacearchaeota archaeon]
MIIDGKNTVLGRLASYAAKEALKGEEIIIVNCNHVIISGNRKNIINEFQQKRKRVGFSQKGPKYSKDNEKIVKKTIRGMLPDHREGRGRIAFKKIKCYQETPEKYLDSKKVSLNTGDKNKFIEVQEVFK